MRPRTMLLAAAAMATVRCSSDGGPCGDGSYGFCAADAASDAPSVPDAAPPGFYGFGDAGPYDAASDTTSDGSDDVSDANVIDARFDGP
jgi:hypothetical protein